MTGKKITFVPDKCIQCRGCEVACKTWRNVELGLQWRKIETYWQGTGIDARCIATTFACKHCDQPECAQACPFDAITKDAVYGVVSVDQAKCTGCGVCFSACPFAVPQFGASGKMQKCDLCFSQSDQGITSPPCVSTCPTKALVLSMDV